MAVKNLVIVESPAKAKTINKYLGSGYVVVASYGHIRDLPPKDGSVQPDNDFDMIWELSERSKKHVNEIVKLAKASEIVYLATDPDREGEAISWHVTEVLKDKKILEKTDIKRVTFNEITKTAVNEAFENARDLDQNMVQAYLARRALDYLVGFNLSPVLWRKLPGSRSAGRVQSVALRLICEREAEIEAFNSQEYWSIETLLTTNESKSFTAKLHSVNGERLDKLAVGNEEAAQALVNRIEASKLTVDKIVRKQSRRNPYPPFITSTLQQEASRKLGFGATKTMRTAQSLYEGAEIAGETVGLITYMRTDGVTLSNDAISAAREYIGNKFGNDFVPENPRMYKSKAKNAQEAHEAIRPTDLFRSPEDVRKYVGDDEARLYELIWKRTIACQMESAILDQVAVDIINDNKDLMLRANGSIVTFEGFYKVYTESKDDGSDDTENERHLPPLNEKELLDTDEVTPNQHFTQPPPRYSEASLVKKMEELGIGRPSTYASILQVLRDRDYVILEKKRLVPENRGRIVTTFLENFFKRYVEYDFTADLESQLDEISAGSIGWQNVLTDFWGAFSETIDKTKELRITEVIDALDAELAPILFPKVEGSDVDPRKCPQCDDGKLNLKLGKFGAFVGCTNYPECKFTRPFMSKDADDDGPEEAGPKELGNDPETGRAVSLRKGPYGPYVQLEAPEVLPEPEPEPEPEETKGKKKKKKKKKAAPKPKRTSIPRGMEVKEIDLAKALQLLSLPREIGNHPESGEMIKAGIGRFGPYLVHLGKFKSIPKDDPEGVLTIGLNRAVDLLAKEGKKGFGELKALGEHPDDKKPVTINRGRYGTYIKHGKSNAPIPKDREIESISLEDAVEWIKAKIEKDATKKKKGKK